MIRSQKILDNILEYKHAIKRFVLLASILILFGLYNSRITRVIEKFFLIESELPLFFDIVVITSFAVITIYLIWKFISRTYLVSFLELFFSALVSGIILFYLINKDLGNWNYLHDSIFGVKYINYLLIPALLFIILSIYVVINKSFIQKRVKRNNTYLNDDPILSKEEDELNYQAVVDKVSHILLNENHKKSFTIGLVGPWGNGKSSVFELVQNNLKSHEFLKNYNKEKRNFISINFLPYLNHKEDEIINEFFELLGSKLSKYNGELSSLIRAYSQKLTDLYNDKNILGFFDRHVSISNNLPAKDLYEKINHKIKKVNKKIVVFIDDLDRLDDKEILQVLKLIRNTANFSSTIFLVAMDKDYVISRLKSNSEILNSKFIEKFFQLEVYLPEIDKAVLKENFSGILLNRLGQTNSDLPIRTIISDSLNDDKNLFDDYIKNFRDIKRVINQIIFDYPFIKNEIDFTDFTNFTFLKLKFPGYIKLLKDNLNGILELDEDKQIYKLRPSKKAGEIDEKKKDIILLSFRKPVFDSKQLEKYEIKKVLKSQEECIKDSNNLDCDDQLLLLKTLAHLFGDQNPLSDYKSIKFENNLRMLLEQRIFEHVIKESEFKQLINSEGIDTIKTEILKLKEQGKLYQLTNRLNYFNGKDLKEIDSIILVLVILYNTSADYDLTDLELLNLLNRFTIRKFELNDSNENVSNWLVSHVLDGDLLNNYKRLILFGELFKTRSEIKRWFISTQTFTEKAKIYYSRYLKELKGLWDLNDYSFYEVYHSLKLIPDVQKHLNEEQKKFWKRNNIELLCAQTLNFGSFSTTSYNISDFEKMVFGTKENFYKFVKSHKDKEKPAVKEFIEFLKLCNVTNFQEFLKYTFVDSQLARTKIENHIQQYGDRSLEDDYRNFTQVIFETNYREIFETFSRKNNPKPNYSFRYYPQEKHYYILASFKTSTYQKDIFDLVDDLRSTIIDESIWTRENMSYTKHQVLKKQEFLKETGSNKYVKVISIQS